MELRPTPDARLFAFIRSQAKLSQTSFALLLSTSKATLSRIENGNGKPTAQHYQRLAQAFGLTPAQLVEAQYSHSLEKQPGCGYTPQVPTMHELSLDQQQMLHVFLEDDLNHLKRTIAREEQRLLNAHVLEEVRATSRQKGTEQLEAQQAVLEALQNINAAEHLLEAQQRNVALAEKELKSIQAWSHMRPEKQAYKQLKLEGMKAEQARLEAELEALKTAIAAAKAAEEKAPEPAAPEQDRVPAEAAVAQPKPRIAGKERVPAPRRKAMVPIPVEVEGDVESNGQTRVSLLQSVKHEPHRVPAHQPNAYASG